MTKIETVATLMNTVLNSTSNTERKAAALEIVAIKKAAKTSFAKLGIDEANEAFIDRATKLVVRERGDAKATPAGVHKLSKLPKGNDVKGKVWANVIVTMPDGTELAGRVETKRGSFVYFTDAEGQGYRAEVRRFKTEDGNFDLRPRD